jgi:hypothetical protein
MRISNTLPDRNTRLATSPRPVNVSLMAMLAVTVCAFSLQFGYSVHLSVAGACFILALVYSIKKLTPLRLALGLIGAVLIVMPVIFSPGDFTSSALYRSIREAACFLVLVVLARVEVEFGIASKARIACGLWITNIGLLLITMLQAIDLKFGRSGVFFVPYTYFPRPISLDGCWTVASCWLEFGHLHGIPTEIRPAATYAEPSYLGFVVLCLVFVSRKIIGESGIGRIAFVSVAMATVLLAQTTSGIVALVLMLFATRKRSLWKSAGLILASLLFLSGAAFMLSDRFTDIMQGSDVSFLGRLIYPLQAVGEALQQGYLLGVPSEYLGKVVSSEVIAATGMATGASDNALINMFLLYGMVGGVLVLTILFLRRGFPEIVLLLLSMQFNGAIFMYDKVVMLSLVLVLYKARFQDEGTPATASEVSSASSDSFPASTSVAVQVRA